MVKLFHLLGALAIVLLTSDLSVRYPIYGWTFGMVCAIIVKPMIDAVRGNKNTAMWHLARKYLQIAYSNGWENYSSASASRIIAIKEAERCGINDVNEAKNLLGLEDHVSL